MSRKAFRFLPLLALLCLSILSAAQSRKVSGCVLLHSDGKTVPGENVTAYVKACSAGTIADSRGDFILFVPDGYASNSLQVELSLIGYESKVVPVHLMSGTTVAMDTVVLDIQPLMLTAAYLIDNGMPAEQFILSKVWDKADANRKQMDSYNADVRYRISTHEIPVVAQVLSAMEKGAVKLFAGFTGFGPLVRYCLSNDDVSASVSMRRTVNGKKTADSNKSIVSDGAALPEDVAANIMNLPNGIDFFEAVYNRRNLWGEKFTKKHTFTLIGTYEYGGKLVDVLHCSDSQKIINLYLHVVEEDWGFLRVEIKRDGETMLFECRDISNGIYMPVSLVMKPTMSLVRNVDIPEAIKKISANRHLSKRVRKRSESILTERYESGQDFNPYIVAGFNISYSGFKAR